jgi:hypothetical protein
MLITRFLWLSISLVIFSLTFLSAQDEYSYSYMPKMLHENQLFPITIVGFEDDSPTLTFDISSPIQPIFKDPLIVRNGKDTFYTFYFKASSVTMFIPMLFISSPFYDISLDKRQVPIVKLEKNSNFSSVLATSFKIKSQQVSNYDDKNHMVTLMVEAYEANIEDMILQNIKEFGIDNLNRKNAKVTAEFYAVLPRNQKELSFSYFNTTKNRFIEIKVPVQVVNTSVTTQSDLNPKIDAFDRLKRYTLITFLLFFIIMFFWKRDFFYLILGLLSIIALLTFYIPHKKICVKQGSPLYILPTSTSTIGTYVDNRLESMLLGSRENYNKIEYKKGIIGWIKDEDICKN